MTPQRDYVRVKRAHLELLSSAGLSMVVLLKMQQAMGVRLPRPSLSIDGGPAQDLPDPDPDALEEAVRVVKAQLRRG